MGTKSEPERLLTIEQVAELTGYTVDTIDQWRARGLPFIAAGVGRRRPRRKDVRIRASSLWEWIGGLEVTRRPPEGKPARRGRAPKLVTVPAADLSAWRTAKKASEPGA